MADFLSMEWFDLYKKEVEEDPEMKYVGITSRKFHFHLILGRDAQTSFFPVIFDFQMAFFKRDIVLSDRVHDISRETGAIIVSAGQARLSPMLHGPF